MQIETSTAKATGTFDFVLHLVFLSISAIALPMQCIIAHWNSLCEANFTKRIALFVATLL